MPRSFASFRAGLRLALVALAAGCSDAAESDVDVSGAWCGKQVATAAECSGDEVQYIELTQSADVVTGSVCEDYDSTCYDIQSGQVADGQLTFFYTFSTYRVDASFDVLDDKTMQGSFLSSKCACSVPLTLHRLN